MASTVSPETYREAILFLGTAGIVVPLFHRLRISPVLGFIAAGALLGPHALGRLAEAVPALRWVTIQNRSEISHLAEFGVVFLLFMIGIELSWERLRVLRRLVFGLGASQVLACTLALAAFAAVAGAGPLAAVVIGLALALSSTAIVVPVLAERRRLNLPAGRASFSVLLFQDLAVAPILFTVAALGSGQTAGAATAFALTLAQAILAVALIVVVGRVALRPLFQLVAATRSPEAFMAACLLVVLATGLVAALSGLSMALGAFVAGLLLAETEYRRAIEATIEPFKGLLLGVFFLSVGMSLDLTRLAEAPGPILVVSAGLVAVKAGIVLVLARAFRLAAPVAWETALLLGSGGEFAFVILASAMGGGLVPPEYGQAALVVATLTMVATPLLARIGRLIGEGLEKRGEAAAAPPEPPPEAEAPRVIIAGWGRVGQLVGEMLARHGVPFIGVDLNASRVAAERSLGKPVYFGDLANLEFMRRCGLETARALVVTVDEPAAIEAMVAAARSERPDLTIVVRARDARHASALYDLGVTDAVPETIEASLQLSEAVLVDIGLPMGLVIASVHERRDEFRKTLMPARADRPEANVFQGRRSAGGRRG